MAADDRFKFQLDKKGSDFFADAQKNVEGGAAESVETSFLLSLVGSASVDPTLMGQFAFQQQTFLQSVAQQKQSDSVLSHAAQLQLQADLAAANQETDPVAKQQNTAAAYQKYGQTLKPATAPTPPTPAGQSLPDAPLGKAAGNTDAATKAFSGGQFTAPGKLLSGDLVLSDRAAIEIAAGDFATKSIFEVLGDPTAASQFNGKKVMFAVAMVSVDPGWRTRKDYAADITLHVSYKYVPARDQISERYDSQEKALEKTNAPSRASNTKTARANALKTRDGSAPTDADGLTEASESINPLVMAVSPMNDSQVLNLQNSKRDQSAYALELAAALRAAGLQAQADIMSAYAKREQRDVSTRSQNSVMNTYGVVGGTVGIEVGPNLQAIEDPTNAGPAANVLGRQSFPVLLIIGMDPSDLTPKVVKGRSGEILCEPQIHIGQTTSWKPLRSGLPKFSEQDRLTTAVEIRRATNALRSNDGWQSDANVQKEFGPGIQILANERLEAMRIKINGGYTNEYLPLDFIIADATPSPPKVTGVTPNAILFKPGTAPSQDVPVVITGNNLKVIDVDNITLVQPGVATPVKVAAKAAGGVILATIPITQFDVPVVLELPIKADKNAAPDELKKNTPGSIFSLPVIGSLESVPYIERNDAKGKDRLEFRGVSDEILKAEIEKNKPTSAATQPQKVTVP